MAEKINSAMIPDDKVCIVSVGYNIEVDGDPGCPIIEDVNLPATIAASARYILANPFGAGVPVDVEAEIANPTDWASTDVIYNATSNVSTGVRASRFNGGESIVLRTCGSIAALPIHSGNAFADDTQTANPKCRIYVTRGKQ